MQACICTPTLGPQMLGTGCFKQGGDAVLHPVGRFREAWVLLGQMLSDVESVGSGTQRHTDGDLFSPSSSLCYFIPSFLKRVADTEERL